MTGVGPEQAEICSFDVQGLSREAQLRIIAFAQSMGATALTAALPTEHSHPGRETSLESGVVGKEFFQGHALDAGIGKTWATRSWLAGLRAEARFYELGHPAEKYINDPRNILVQKIRGYFRLVEHGITPLVYDLGERGWNIWSNLINQTSNAECSLILPWDSEIHRNFRCFSSQERKSAAVIQLANVYQAIQGA